PTDHRRDRQQRLPRHGSPVAGHVLRGALLADPPDAERPGLRDARPRVRCARLHCGDGGGARGRAVRGARVGAHLCGRRAGRPAGALLPDDPGRGRRARCDRVPRRGSGDNVKHTVSVLVENRPGALMRVTSLFARRGFNIDSLAVGPTERHDVSRITLRVDCEHTSLEQIEKQMHYLVNVLLVEELAPGESVERELALLKVAAPPGKRPELMALADVFGAQVADLGPDSIVFELV